MLLPILTAFAVLQTPVRDTVRQEPDAATIASSYADAGARELVRLARDRPNTIDRSISEYQAVVQERMSAGLRTLGRERLIYRRETAARVDWKRQGTIGIEMLGAREVAPGFMSKAQVPDDLRGFMPHLAFDPVDNDLLVRLDTTFVQHPLAIGSEAHYRFRSGDTTTIRLPDGRQIRLIELVVEPRRTDVHLITGSFWFDAVSHGVVQAVFRLARAFDFDRDADEDDDDDVPGFVKPIRAELMYVTMEYGLWDLHWWMPRLIAAEGVFQMSMVSMPLKYERRYSEYRVTGDTTMAPVAVDTGFVGPCRVPFRMNVSIGSDDDSPRRQRAREARDSARVARRDSIFAAQLREDSIAAANGEDTPGARRRRCRREYDVALPDDTASLLAGQYLPSSIFESGEALITEGELSELGERLKNIPEPPWQLQPPRFAIGPSAAGMFRYNRIESLSTGARGDLDLGRAKIDGAIRVGLADWEPNAEVGISRERPAITWRLAGYRRLAAANPANRPLAIGNSVHALLFGRDDGEYFRAAGGELIVKPAITRPQWWELRLFGERQWRADVETDFSLAHAIDGDRVFRPNIRARDADQFGGALVLRYWHGLDPVGFRWGAEASLEGSAGTFDFFRPSLTLRTAAPIGGGLIGSLEAAGGTTVGDSPIQSHWFLGGPPSLRGYDGAVIEGDAFWRGRAELATQLPAARLSMFSDVGWAGPRADFSDGGDRVLYSAGIGASFMDGLVRFDLARALRRPVGWRADLYVGIGL
jgi:hypothetical protein